MEELRTWKVESASHNFSSFPHNWGLFTFLFLYPFLSLSLFFYSLIEMTSSPSSSLQYHSAQAKSGAHPSLWCSSFTTTSGPYHPSTLLSFLGAESFTGSITTNMKDSQISDYKGKVEIDDTSKTLPCLIHISAVAMSRVSLISLWAQPSLEMYMCRQQNSTLRVKESRWAAHRYHRYHRCIFKHTTAKISFLPTTPLF